MKNDDECSSQGESLNNIIYQLSAGKQMPHVEGMLRRAAHNFFNDIALIDEERSLSYAELYFRSLQLSKALLARGIKPLDRVIICCNNSIEFYVFYFAIWQTGAIAVPVNTFLESFELAQIINDCAPKMALCSENLKKKLNCPKLSSELSVGLPDVICELSISWDDLVPATIDKFPQLVPVELGIDECCLILYTSGTTGNSKGVMLSSKNIMTNSAQVMGRVIESDCNQKERYFAVLPLFHVFAQNACIWIPIMTGSSIVIVPRIERGAIIRGLKKLPTIFLGFPALYGLLCLMRNAPLNSIKIFISGADTLSDKIRAGFGMIYGRAICSGYGLTEACPAISMDTGNLTDSTDSVGPVLAGIECSVRDSDGLEVEPGQIGTLFVRGGNIMLGYYNSPEQTAKIIKDGWLDTGDLVSINKSGKIRICGREKDLIIHKGLNIYPQEVEQVLLAHPQVYQAAVIGKPDEEHGQVPIAYVVLKDNKNESWPKLQTFCAARLAAYKIPRRIICVEALPLNATGKIDKKSLVASQ